MNEVESIESMLLQGVAMSENDNTNEINVNDSPAENLDTHEDDSHEHSAYLDGLMKDLNTVQDPESKLQKVIAFMENALAQTGRPHFKSFWQARSLCLQLFKDESLSPTSRTALWNKYTELSKTARRLKDHFDEQSAFAVEQIEIAINALDTEITQTEQNKDQIQPSEIPVVSKALEPRYPYYRSIQGELDFLNSKASRINSLRKELINTGMPSRKKNKFFQRLSQLGDRVFPRRKELIQTLSENFISDVDTFMKNNFAKDKNFGPLFILREEIKSLQAIAKHLTLNTQAFTQTRMSLSECWDKVKQVDKERKKERTQQKSVFKQNEDTVKAKIEELKGILSTLQTPSEGLKKIDEVSTLMRQLQLGRGEVKALKEELEKLRQPFHDQLKAADQRRHEQETERQQQKERHVQELKSDIDNLLKSGSSISMEQLIAKRDSLSERIQTSQISRTEKQEFERLMKPLRDVLLEKKAQALKNLSDNDRQALDQLKDLLNERKELRHEVKEQVETLRRAVGSSGLDFEKALEYNAQLSTQKERLEKINHGIAEVEYQIEELEAKLF